MKAFNKKKRPRNNRFIKPLNFELKKGMKIIVNDDCLKCGIEKRELTFEYLRDDTQYVVEENEKRSDFIWTWHIDWNKTIIKNIPKYLRGKNDK